MDKADILAGVRALRERIERAVNVTAVSEDKDLLLAMADVVERAMTTNDPEVCATCGSYMARGGYCEGYAQGGCTDWHDALGKESDAE